MKTLKTEKSKNQKWFKEWWVWLIVFIVGVNITFIFLQFNKFSNIHQEKSLQQTNELKNKDEMINSLLNNPEFLYINELEHQTDQWVTLFSNFYNVIQKSSNTEQWREDLLVELVSMKLLVEEAKSISPPENMENINKQFIEAIDHFNFMIETIPSALENNDKELTEKCMYELTIGAEELQKTKDLISSFSEDASSSVED